MGLPSTVETALVSYLEHSIKRAGLTIRRARDGGGPVDGPLLTVHATTAGLHPDVPPSAASRILDVECAVRAQSLDGTTRGLLLDTLGEIENAFLDQVSLRASTNAPTSGADLRAVDNLTVHDATPVGMRPAIEDGRNLEVTLRYRLALTPAD